MGTEDIIDQLDPEIARQMGFTSFGGAKRRKLANADDAVTDVQESKKDQDEAPPSGANAEEIIPGGYNDPILPPGLGIYGTRAVPSKLITHSEHSIEEGLICRRSVAYRRRREEAPASRSTQGCEERAWRYGLLPAQLPRRSLEDSGGGEEASQGSNGTERTGVFEGMNDIFG